MKNFVTGALCFALAICCCCVSFAQPHPAWDAADTSVEYVKDKLVDALLSLNDAQDKLNSPTSQGSAKDILDECYTIISAWCGCPECDHLCQQYLPLYNDLKAEYDNLLAEADDIRDGIARTDLFLASYRIQLDGMDSQNPDVAACNYIESKCYGIRDLEADSYLARAATLNDNADQLIIDASDLYQLLAAQLCECPQEEPVP